MEDIKTRPVVNIGIKSILASVLVCLTIGFVIGKIYTWETIITDCKVLGAFRMMNTAFYCKTVTP